MKITVVGAGNVGKALGSGWAKAGHDVTFAVRADSLQKYADLPAELGGKVTVTPMKDAAAGSDVVVLATPWGAAQQAIQELGDLDGRIVVDCMNPLKPALAGLTHSGDDSGAEQVARWATGARVVKAFNTTGFNIMQNPQLEGGPAVMLVCGNDEAARNAVLDLARDLGFDALSAGGLDSARLLEPMAMLWIKLAMPLGHGRNHAFALLRQRGS